MAGIVDTVFFVCEIERGREKRREREREDGEGEEKGERKEEEGRLARISFFPFFSFSLLFSSLLPPPFPLSSFPLL